MTEVSRESQLMICARALVDIRTVERFLHGEKVRPITVERITRAARELGIALPSPKAATP